MNKLIFFVLIAPCISEIQTIYYQPWFPTATIIRHDNSYRNSYNNDYILNSSPVTPTQVKRVNYTIKTQPSASLLPLGGLSTSASNYLDSLKILLAKPWCSAPSPADIKLTFARGLIVPAFILTVMMSEYTFKYLEKNWVFQGQWNGLTTKELTTIALSLHLAHSLFKLFVLRLLFINNLTSLRCPIKNLFFPMPKSLLTRIVQSNPKAVTTVLGVISIGFTAASLYAGLILSETGWGTAHPSYKVVESVASIVTLVSLVKSIVLKEDFGSWLNLKHFVTPLKYRNSVRKSYLVSKLFRSTANLPKEYQSVMLSQREIKFLSILSTILPFASLILKAFPTCLETFSMLLLVAINLNNLSLAGLFVSLVHAVSLFIENIIFNYDKNLLINDIEAIYNRS